MWYYKIVFTDNLNRVQILESKGFATLAECVAVLDVVMEGALLGGMSCKAVLGVTIEKKEE